MTNIKKFRITTPAISLFLMFGLTFFGNASAKKSNMSDTLTHEQVTAKELPLVNRELQLLVNNVSSRMLDQAPANKGVGIVLLDSGRVASFNSTSGYIYLTRGMLLMTKTENDLAAIIALEMADLEQQWRSDIKHWQRAADILKTTGYNPSNLPSFLSILIEHKRLVDKEQSAQSLLGESYPRLPQRHADSVLKKLFSYVSKLEGGNTKPVQIEENEEYLNRFAGLAIGQSPNLELRNSASQTIKEKGFTVFLPESWRAFRQPDINELIPVKSKALNIQSNDSVLVLRSSSKQASEVIVYGAEKPKSGTTAADRLRQHIETISKSSKTSLEGQINGDTWQGYFIEGKVKHNFEGGVDVPGLSLGKITMTIKHRTAIMNLKEKVVIATTFITPFMNDYDKLDREAFMNIVSSISDPNNEAGKLGPKHTLKIHQVSAGETLLSLAESDSLPGSINALRMLNGMQANDNLKAGQLIKLIESRNQSQ